MGGELKRALTDKPLAGRKNRHTLLLEAILLYASLVKTHQMTLKKLRISSKMHEKTGMRLKTTKKVSHTGQLRKTNRQQPSLVFEHERRNKAEELAEKDPYCLKCKYGT